MKKLIMISLICLLLLTSCNRVQQLTAFTKHNKDHVQTIKIGYLPITHAANLMMTKQIEQQTPNSKYHLELVKFNNWPDLMDALNSGRIDGASTLIELAMKSKQKGANIKAVALGHHEGNVIMGQKHKGVSDFHNNTSYSFAIPHRYSTHYLLLEEMRKQLKLKKHTFDYHEMSPAEMPAALSEQRISGYSVAEPFGAIGAALEKGQVLKHGDEVMPDAYCCVLVLRGEVLQQRHLAQAFVKDYKQAGFKMNDKQQSVDIMTKYFKQQPKVLKQSAAWTSYGDLSIRASGYNKIAKLVNEHHLFNTPDYDDFVAPSFYKEAQK
ncbi:ABC transporter substrate-binding protein [Staphylococcus simiae]|uniref:ABC transporter substrate-binding protein n=1 Tax=Staphylococcus simiae TaxID=308354 RepID=UPI001A97B3A5|nr:ABC transporter substrate-binding protein [Staphylococcus simiae]MBO1198869.1 ABC transporter substrate-binding protein [Staphylococcus simiae]MBO1201105.1 ABC transporter substrate-binding protein [Staphylococcus simiae]MBO1203269.1 ABC transporter substrate-binding protein [Staphylococcus simiae]MBO1210782.1 ABC transporter substrate-binding protein [Staphylococcus simiae]MBO1229443.1 ABC transporter substrate-binding protein [Staphylococcus simiae]